MKREEALKLLEKNLKNRNLQKHSLAVEACMKAFAQKFEEDVEKWALAGLLHDLDYEYTVNDPENHTLKTVELLSDYDLDEDILLAIKAHNMKSDLKSTMDIALYTIDPATGFIIACALMHPEKKLKSLDMKFLKNRFKEKSFARGANREQIKECEKMAVGIDDFLSTCLSAMQSIDSELGL